MAVPKRKTSPAKRGMRRSADALKAPTYVEDKDSAFGGGWSAGERTDRLPRGVCHGGRMRLRMRASPCLFLAFRC
jgi:hypothetical protein